MKNFVLCVGCGKWILNGCAGLKMVSPSFYKHLLALRLHDTGKVVKH